MRKNSKEYFINIIRTSAGKGVQFVSENTKNSVKNSGIQLMGYNECHKLLQYFPLIAGKKYSLKYLKEQSVYAENVLQSILENRNVNEVF